MSPGWTTVVVASVLVAVAMVVWNVFLTALLEIAKRDVRRLTAIAKPARQPSSILTHRSPR